MLTPDQMADFRARCKRQYDANRMARYHVWSHAEAVATDALALFDVEIEEHGGPSPRGRAICEVAALAHDVIYVPAGSFNERLSAEWLQCVVYQLPVGHPLGMLHKEAGGTIISATDHFGGYTACTVSGCAVHDADLAPLAAAPDVFDANNEALREEYGLPATVENYRKHLAVLDTLLAQNEGRMYLLPLAQERWLSAALANVERFRASLTTSYHPISMEGIL